MANLINLATQLNYGANSSPFGAETAVLLTTTQVVTLSQGVWQVSLGGSAGGGATLEYSPDSGTTWRPLARGEADSTKGGASSAAAVFSDGFNLRIKGNNSVSTTTTYYTQVKSLF